MDPEAELLKSMDKEELEQAVKLKIASFHGLLTRDVAVRLIAKEKGLLKTKEEVCRLGEVPKGAKKVGFRARVKKVWPLVTYSSGKSSLAVEVKDETGEMPLIFWNKDAELVKGLRAKDVINVSGAYEKSGELHFGYSGKLEIEERAGFSDLGQLDDNETVHLKGTISKVEGYDRFVRDGRTSMAFSFIVSDDRIDRRAVIWDKIERGERLKQGDEVLLEGAHVRKGDIDLDLSSRIKIRRKGDVLMGTLKGIECEGEGLSVEVDDRTVTLDRQNALRFMGVDVADDIELSTVVELKKETLLNTRIAVKIEERDGQILIRG
jgi:hypothetical protein